MSGFHKRLPGLSILSALAGFALTGAAQDDRPAPEEVFQEQIGVEVLNIDVVVTDRKGRFVTPFTSDPAELTAALAAAGEKPAVGIQHKNAHSSALRNVRDNVSVEVAVPVDQLTLIPHGNARNGRLIVIVTAPDRKGKTSIRKKEIALTLPLPTAQDAGETYRFGVNVELRAGEHKLGVGIWDEIAGTGSFLSLDVEALEPDQEEIQP